MEITSLSQLDLTKLYSYADYYSWKFQERVELFKGKIMQMSPAPSRQHQTVSRIISTKIINFLENSPCQVFYAPFDVRLDATTDDRQVTTVVQPDICVVCDEAKLDERGCNGAPDLIVEILSPGNSAKEMKYKFELYESAGVHEYWIVNPQNSSILQYVQEEKGFVTYRPLIIDDYIHSKTLSGLSIQLEQIFEKNK